MLGLDTLETKKRPLPADDFEAVSLSATGKEPGAVPVYK